MKIDDAEIYAVYGRRGSGKSYLIKKMMRDFERVIVFDPMGEYKKVKGFKCFETIEAMHAHIVKNWSKGFKVALPCKRFHPKKLHELSLYVWELQQAAQRKIMFVVEELSMGYPARNFKDKYYGFPQLLLQGRHRGIEIVGLTQRPNLVQRTFRSMVAKTFIFPMEDEDDIALVGRKIGRSRLEEYRNMKPFFHVRTGGGEYVITKA